MSTLCPFVVLSFLHIFKTLGLCEQSKASAIVFSRQSVFLIPVNILILTILFDRILYLTFSYGGMFYPSADVEVLVSVIFSTRRLDGRWTE